MKSSAADVTATHDESTAPEETTTKGSVSVKSTTAARTDSVKGDAGEDPTRSTAEDLRDSATDLDDDGRSRSSER